MQRCTSALDPLSVKKGMDNDDDFYNEVNAAGKIVASYHIWHHMSIYPPFNASEGWKKFDLQEKEIASGKCS
jgi:hypothetical protein